MRRLLRGPLLLDRLGLRWTMGERMLILVHRGRRTGAIRQTALEVIARDRARSEYAVMSAWGEAADWFMNLATAPAVEVRVGRRRFRPRHRVLGIDEATEVLRRYERDHPRFSRFVWRLFGWDAGPTEERLDRLALTHPVVAFSPHSHPVPVNYARDAPSTTLGDGGTR